METRKIQQVGGGTYTVSLPKQWADAADIEPGAVVGLHTHIDGTLVVQTGTDDDETTTQLSLTVPDDDEALERLLRGAYAAGAETIELDAAETFTDRDHRTVERLTRNLTGVAVTETTAKSVSVRTLLDAGEVSITQSVRQLQFAALSTHRDAMATLTGPTTVENPSGRDDQADRIYAMVDRYFQRGIDRLDVMDALGLTRPTLFVRWATARELEGVADQAERIATVANDVEESVDDEFATQIDELAASTRDLVRRAVSVVLEDSGVSTAHGVLDERDQIRDDVAALDRELFETACASYRLTHVLAAVGRTADHAGSIAELGLRSLLRDVAETDQSLDID